MRVLLTDLRGLFVVLGVFGVVLTAFGQIPELEEPEYKFEYTEPPERKLQESAVSLPPLPKEKDLLPVGLLGPATINLFVDKRSVSVGGDGVVRLTYVVESATGVRNVFFEGFDCREKRYKTYAFGAPPGGWQQVRGSKWQEIPDIVTNAYRMQFYTDYLCDDLRGPRTVKEIIRYIRYVHSEYEE